MNSLIGWKQSFVQKIAVVLSLALVFASATPVAEAMLYKTQPAHSTEISATLQVSAQSHNLNSPKNSATAASYTLKNSATAASYTLKNSATVASYTLREMGLSAKLSAGAGNNLSAQDIEAALTALDIALSGTAPSDVALSEAARQELRALAKERGLKIPGLEDGDEDGDKVETITAALDGGHLTLRALHQQAKKVAGTLIDKLTETLTGTLTSTLPGTLTGTLPSTLTGTLPGTLPGTLTGTLTDKLPSTLPGTLQNSALAGALSDASAADPENLSAVILEMWQVAVNELRLMLQGRTTFLNAHKPQTSAERNHRAAAINAIYNLAGLPENAFTPQSTDNSVTIAQLWQLVRYHALYNLATRVDLSNLARAGSAASTTITQLLGKPALMTDEERVEEFLRDLADYNRSSPEAKKKSLLKKAYSILKNGSNFPSGLWAEDREWLEEKLLEKFSFKGEGYYRFAYGSRDEKGNRKVLVFQLRSIGEEEKGSEKPVVIDKIYVRTMPSVTTTTKKLYHMLSIRSVIKDNYSFESVFRTIPSDSLVFMARNDKAKLIKSLDDTWYITRTRLSLSVEDAINQGDAFEPENITNIRSNPYGPPTVSWKENAEIKVLRAVDGNTPKDASIHEKTFWEFSGEVARDGSMDIEMGGARVGYDLLMNDDTLPQDLGQLGAWREGFVSRLKEIKAEAETGSLSEKKAQALREQLFVFMQRPISTNVEDLNQTPLRRLKNLGIRFDETVPILLDAKGDEKIQYWNDPSFEYGRDFFIKDNEISLGNSRWGGENWFF